MGAHTGPKLYVFCSSLPVAVCPLLPIVCPPLPAVYVSLSSLSEGLSITVSALYVPQMRESHWEAETLDKEGLSESVRSCESCPGV